MPYCRKSSYYSWLRRKPGKRDLENAYLTELIKKIFFESKKTYGSPKITLILKNLGIRISRNRLTRIMKKENLNCVIKKKFVVTTDSKHKYPQVSNKLKRNFRISEPGKVWVSDLTYIRTSQGWFNLNVIIDLWDRKVVGWSLRKSLKSANITVPAWIMAIRNRPITRKLIFHSDRGVQYACNEFRKLQEANKLVTRTMSRKGDCWDNAVAESFFNSLKVECVYQHKYRTRLEVAVSIFEHMKPGTIPEGSILLSKCQ